MILENYLSAESQVVAIDPAFFTTAEKDAGEIGFTISVC